MKIIAYSDTHFGTPETLSELELSPDYSLCIPFIDIVLKEKPDVLICCGDFSEVLWDGIYYTAISEKLREMTNIFIGGNHDPAGKQSTYFKDGVLYIHGHLLIRAQEDYINACHIAAGKMSHFIVMGHTHSPLLTDRFMDIGGLTLTRSFGIIRDGSPELKFI